MNSINKQPNFFKMAKGLFGGMTDYSNQSILDIVEDIQSEIIQVTRFIESIELNVKRVKANGYWKKVPYNFRSIVSYSLTHYRTTKSELRSILREINFEIKEHHCKRLERISNVASEINVDIGRIWHQEYDEKEYGNPDFEIVENIYGDTRDMAVRLLDFSNISVRLTDYIGKQKMKNNPWIAGLFYLLAIVVILATLAVISNYISWMAMPIIIIGGILILGIVGALQLRNDDMLKEENFIQLMVETYKRLPLLKTKK